MNKMSKMQKKASVQADQYNDPKYNYQHYWDGREYEHAAEEMAVRRLLKGKHFAVATDLGGGYGRLCKLLTEYADKVNLIEPSSKQLEMASIYLKDYPQVQRILGQASDIALKTNSCDLVTMVRVMHHLPDPSKEFAEISRILNDKGLLILEVANYAHGRNRIKHLLRGKKMPLTPVDIRQVHKNPGDVSFVNHNPATVIKQLAHNGLRVESVLSVSNLRSPALKKILPKNLMLKIEKVMQPSLAKTFFGPSIFLLVKKAR